MNNYFFKNTAGSQPMNGTTGLLNVPSDEMQADGTFFTGTNYLPLGDIQKAIWELIDDGTFGLPSGERWKSRQERVNAIVCEEEANGEGFEP